MILRIITLLVAISLFAFSPIRPENAGTVKGDKGLFIIQFSWDPDSYDSDHRIAFNYRKISKLNLRGAPMHVYVTKSETTALELAPGEYEIFSVEFYTMGMGGKTFTIQTQLPFTITSGQVVNGGLTFIIKEPGSNKVMLLSLDNEKDAQWYTTQFQKQYAASGMSAAWKFADKEKTDKLKKSYEELVVEREKAKPRKGVKYLYGVLGVLVKLDKTSDGAVKGFQSIETGTYREITRATSTGDKLFCTLGQGQYLYGTDQGVSVVALPQDVESEPHVYLLGADKFLAVDENLNIFSSSGPTLAWKKQADYRVDPAAINPQFNIPYVSFGPDKIYLYTTGPNKFKRLWYSGYDDINFKKMELPEDIKRIPLVTATKNKLVIGPITSSLIKNQASIYVKETNANDWQLLSAPRGDCDLLYIDSNDDNKFSLVCGFSGVTKSRSYRSVDGGKSWEEAVE
ncbi:hypothetical protein KK083_17740 [Fulvivirgaceae bacterium PWU4]|uniref:Uncharacterized protein n=1 Tax=Chryseosolibacter histidini TaxID=2782349 RepID=A0AAP2GK70_9BACT|nr:hypothetical protein [Chryseosolibacter histidini]MBT1698739.1 hypothetical protein [Chryseosolibacter histidini]